MLQDALILHIIYSIVINSETVVLLTFDSIDENGKWDILILWSLNM